ncbi:MAG: S8 family serine peptidase [Anaerolineae bacterium]|nr:S8 family serine peptidase [Candidatus Roseilinea sp.]MDW8451396.1 S8 family serine peptidase [Anaerolineae bacterium]
MQQLRLFIASALCLVTLTAWRLPAPPEPPPRISARAWAATAGQGAVADVIVTAPGYPDLSPAYALRTKEAKTRFVAQALLAHAERAQAQLRADLAARGLSFFPLWITNQIVVRGVDRPTLRWLGARRDVIHIDLDEQTRGIERVTEYRHPTPHSLLPTPNSPGITEWGVRRVNAPQVWAMGYTGQGIVIANLDTGVRWDHTALKAQYRGWDGASATHDYNWFDAAPATGNPPSPVPVDVNGHGTHTTGTAVGDGGPGNQIGVAPGAKWIACRNMAGPTGIGSVARYIACFQFALAPTDVNGNAPDPARSADITSNSWACDPDYGELGCDVPTALITATQALRDAGIMVVASAGNRGSACRSVVHAPATLDQAFTIGATDSSDAIAGFSSRGPSSLTGRIKPDVVAPGVGVRSARPESPANYGLSSGTSMAAPHVAGVVALLWSAAPGLRGDVETTEALLRQTARPLASNESCGGVSGASRPNNTYGYGLVDALAAVHAALSAPVVTAPAAVRMNEPFTVVISATNVTPLTRTGVVISSSLPATLTLISAEPPGAVNGETISWKLPDLAPSSALTVSMVVSAAQASIVTHQAHIWFDGLPSPVAGSPTTTVVSGYRLIFPFVTHNPR